MHPLTPRGRSGGAAALLAVVIALLLVAPAAAAGGLSLTPSQRTVTGSVLTLVVAGGPAQGRATLVVSDAAGNQAVYRFAAAAVADGLALTVDLSTGAGSALRNGRATVALSDSTGTVAQTQVTVDRTALTPSLAAAAEDRHVRVTWSDVAAADPVTFRLERSTGGGAQVVYEGASAAFTDRDLTPGRVTYTLTAGVPGAGGGTNWSPPATTSTKIAAPAASAADAAPVPADRATKPSPARPGKRQAARFARPPRRMAAAGIARPVGGGADPVPTVGYASAPWLDAAAVPHVLAAAPRIAAPRAPHLPEHWPDPFPTRARPAAALAVGPATAGATSPVVAATAALMLLGLAVAAAPRWWRERRDLQRLVLALEHGTNDGTGPPCPTGQSGRKGFA